MIARVRIAPVQQWCEPIGKKDIQVTRPTRCVLLVGQEVKIRTETMQIDTACNGKAWLLTRASVRKLDSLLGRAWDGDYEALICEHLLEMD